MKQTIALAILFIALLAAISAWFAFNGSSDAATEAPNGSIAQTDSTGLGSAKQGRSMEQVIQKVIPKGPQAPEIASPVWLNSVPLSTQDLRDHVVVVEFWTYG